MARRGRNGADRGDADIPRAAGPRLRVGVGGRRAPALAQVALAAPREDQAGLPHRRARLPPKSEPARRVRRPASQLARSAGRVLLRVRSTASPRRVRRAVWLAAATPRRPFDDAGIGTRTFDRGVATKVESRRRRLAIVCPTVDPRRGRDGNTSGGARGLVHYRAGRGMDGRGPRHELLRLRRAAGREPGERGHDVRAVLGGNQGGFRRPVRGPRRLS